MQFSKLIVAALAIAVTACSDERVASTEPTLQPSTGASKTSIVVGGLQYSNLHNSGNALCLEPALGPGQSYGDLGLRVMQNVCQGAVAPQLWTLVFRGTGPVRGRSGAFNLYSVVNLANGQCLDDMNGNTANGAAVQLYPCTGSLNEAWTLGRSFNGGSELVNSHSGNCLDDPMRSTTLGQQMWQYSCFGDLNPAQQWAFF